jgi:hypothetical protein
MACHNGRLRNAVCASPHDFGPRGKLLIKVFRPGESCASRPVPQGGLMVGSLGAMKVRSFSSSCSILFPLCSGRSPPISFLLHLFPLLPPIRQSFPCLGQFRFCLATLAFGHGEMPRLQFLQDIRTDPPESCNRSCKTIWVVWVHDHLETK